jgi:hypothetical protein
MSTTAPIGASFGFGDDPLHNVIARLQELGYKGKGANWTCPGHDDRSPSLRIARGRDGRVVLYCHAGCTTQDVRAVLELPWQAFYPPELRIWGGKPRPDVNALERKYKAGELPLVDIRIGKLPDKATCDMRQIADDMRLLFGLSYAAGERRPMPYSCRFAARRMGWRNGHNRANSAIRDLVKARVIDFVGELPPRGHARGTALYAPPLHLAADDDGSGLVELSEKKPPLEVRDELRVDRAVTECGEEVGMVTAGDRALPGDAPVSSLSGASLDAVHLTHVICSTGHHASPSTAPQERTDYKRRALLFPTSSCSHNTSLVAGQRWEMGTK